MRLHAGILLPSLGRGGVGRVMLTLARALLERGHRIDLVLLRPRGRYGDVPSEAGLYYVRGRRPSRALAPVLKTHPRVAALSPGPLETLREWLALRRLHPGLRLHAGNARRALAAAAYVRAARPDALLSAVTQANVAALLGARLAPVPVAIAIHGDVDRSYSALQRARARALYPEAAAAAAVSRGLAEQAVRRLGLDPDRTRTIYNGLPAAEIARRSAEAPEHPWFSDGGPPVVLAVGRITPQKDHPALVAAFARLRRRRPARLAIMGAGAARSRAALRAAARRLGVAEDTALLDFDRNPFRYMRRAGVVALSSRWEGLGMVLLEAMACGTPVVSTDAPFGPAEILDGGRWGPLVPVGDADALARALGAVLDGAHPPPAELRRRAAEFDTARMADGYERLLADAAAAGPAQSQGRGPKLGLPGVRSGAAMSANSQSSGRVSRGSIISSTP